MSSRMWFAQLRLAGDFRTGLSILLLRARSLPQRQRQMRLRRQDLLLPGIQCLLTTRDSPQILLTVGKTIHRQTRRVLTIPSAQLLLTLLSAGLEDLAISIPMLLGAKGQLLPAILVISPKDVRRGQWNKQVTISSRRSLHRSLEKVRSKKVTWGNTYDTENYYGVILVMVYDMVLWCKEHASTQPARNTSFAGATAPAQCPVGAVCGILRVGTRRL